MDHIETLKSLIARLTSEDLKKAMAHPDFLEAFEFTVDNMDLPFREKDVDDEVTLAHVLTRVDFGLDSKGRLCSEDLTIATEPYSWINGEWVSWADLDDLE